MKLIITTKEAHNLIVRWPEDCREDPSGLEQYTVEDQEGDYVLQCSEADSEAFQLYTDELIESDVLPQKQMVKFINHLNKNLLINDIKAFH